MADEVKKVIASSTNLPMSVIFVVLDPRNFKFMQQFKADDLRRPFNLEEDSADCQDNVQVMNFERNDELLTV